MKLVDTTDIQPIEQEFIPCDTRIYKDLSYLTGNAPRLQ